MAFMSSWRNMPWETSRRCGSAGDGGDAVVSCDTIVLVIAESGNRRRRSLRTCLPRSSRSSKDSPPSGYRFVRQSDKIKEVLRFFKNNKSIQKQKTKQKTKNKNKK